MGQFKTILPTLTVLLFVGCGGGKIPPTRYYALDLPPAPAPSSEALPHTLVVMPLRASSMLSQDRLVYRPSREEVGYYEYDRWAEDPRETVLGALVDRLRASGAFQSVVPFDGRTRSDYVLRARIDRLEEVDFEEQVRVYGAVSGELLDASNSRVVWEDSAEASAPVASPSKTEVVRQLSDATSRSVDALVRSLTDGVRTLPTADRSTGR